MSNFARAKWTILLALLFCYTFIYCGRQNFGFAIFGMQHDLHLTTIDTGIISACMLFFYGIGQAINGNFADRFSARRMLVLGNLLSALFNFITSFATGFWGVLIPWCLNGFSQSLGFASGSKIITNWWQKHERGKAFGLYLSASGISSIVAFVVSILILKYFSWIWLFRLPVILLLASALVFYIFARDKPEDIGLAPIQQDNPRDSTEHRYRYVLQNTRFQLAAVSMGFCSIARYGLLIWVPVSYFDTNKIWISISLPMGMALGCVASGFISDQLFGSNRAIPTILFMLCGAALSLVLWFVPMEHKWMVFSLLFFIGFFVYGPQAPLFALCPDLLGSACSATGVGLMNAYAYAFAAAGEYLIGYMIHHTGHYSATYMIVMGACLLSAISAAMLAAHQPLCYPEDQSDERSTAIEKL